MPRLSDVIGARNALTRSRALYVGRFARLCCSPGENLAEDSNKAISRWEMLTIVVGIPVLVLIWVYLRSPLAWVDAPSAM